MLIYLAMVYGWNTFSVNSRFLARSSSHLARILCKHTPQVNMHTKVAFVHNASGITEEM